MKLSPQVDVVAQQYQKWQYPEPIQDLDAWLVNNWQWFDPKHAHRLFWPNRDFRPDLDILIAGCGTNQAAVIAYNNPGARVVGIDVSEPSLDHQRHLRSKYSLNNLELLCLPIEEVSSLQREFDLVISTGVLHHMADPKAGLQALAGQLKPEGVAAIMVYASYGRIGVEMLKGVFSDMGLRQDEASLSILKAAIATLPKDHPVQSYIAMAPDLAFDAGLIDTFLHGRDRNYTVSECLELVSAAGLVFQDWFFKSPYHPDLTTNDPFHAGVASLPLELQWSVMERIQHQNGCHFFTACRAQRPTASYRIDFQTDAWRAAIPEFRYRCGLEGNVVRRPGWSRVLEPRDLAMVQAINGRRSLGEIVRLVGSQSVPDRRKPQALEEQGRSLFQSLWQSDFLAFFLDSEQPDASLPRPTAQSPDQAPRRPRICLNMIVRNESHIIHKLIDSVAEHIDTWVIVDTGSDDGTPDLIRRLMAERGIPGELHERPWHNFGHNRSEAIALAQGQADYIWVMDADDVLEGEVDFAGLDADAYSMQFRDGTHYWRLQLFRDGLPWRYAGVLHEVAVCDTPHRQERLEGNYHIHSRRLGSRNLDPLKYARDADILLAEVQRNPEDARSVFYLAQSYRDAGNNEQALKWYKRRAEMAGWQEEVYCALFEAARAMEHLGLPWPDVQDAYVRAWNYRPTRAEPLYAIAHRCRVDGDYSTGYQFATQAASLLLPAEDLLFVDNSVYHWRALDEAAVCASWLGWWEETFDHCQVILARDDIPAEDQQRIVSNLELARQRGGL
jgi:SAM-dependent methyltransferase/glycosyltransferase involved in cell wall biosynthesis